MKIPVNFIPLQSFKKGNDSVAQLVEHYTFNVVVLGSNPSGITKKPPIGGFFRFIYLDSNRRAGLVRTFS